MKIGKKHLLALLATACCMQLSTSNAAKNTPPSVASSREHCPFLPIQKGETELHRTQDPATIAVLILAGTDPFAVTATSEETALHYAARLFPAKQAGVIIKAIIDAMDTCAMIVSFPAYSLQDIKRLANQPDVDGYSPLDRLCEQDFDFDSMAVLLSNGADTTWLHPENGSLLIDRIFQVHASPEQYGVRDNLLQAAQLVLAYMPDWAKKRYVGRLRELEAPSFAHEES